MDNPALTRKLPELTDDEYEVLLYLVHGAANNGDPLKHIGDDDYSKPPSQRMTPKRGYAALKTLVKRLR